MLLVSRWFFFNLSCGPEHREFGKIKRNSKSLIHTQCLFFCSSLFIIWISHMFLFTKFFHSSSEKNTWIQSRPKFYWVYSFSAFQEYTLITGVLRKYIGCFHLVPWWHEPTIHYNHETFPGSTKHILIRTM